MKRMWSKNELLRLSDAEIRALIEGGEIENAKPVYIHPIKIYNGVGDTKKFMITLLIFNNDPTPFTLTTLEQYFLDLYTEVGGLLTFLASGFYNDGINVIQSASYLYCNGENKFGVDGANVGASDYASTGDSAWSDLFASGTTFTDGVNKINQIIYLT